MTIFTKQSLSESSLSKTSLSTSFLSKSSMVGLTLLTTVFLAGCNNTDTAETADSTDTADVSTSTDTPVSSGSTVAKLTSQSYDSILFNPLIASGTLTEEQVNCLEARDKSVLINTTDEFYSNHFTKEELAELDSFYNSPTGKKLVDYGNEQIKMMSGVPVETPMTPPSEAEMNEMTQFMQSPIGQKYQQMNNNEGPDGFNAMIEPIMRAEFERCGLQDMF